MFKLSNEIFFPEYIDNFFIFPKNACSRASIGTRASTGTFTLPRVIKFGITKNGDFQIFSKILNDARTSMQSLAHCLPILFLLSRSNMYTF